MVTVYFYMKSHPKDYKRFETMAEAQAKDYKRFETMAEAQAFIKAMKLCNDCEAVGIHK